MLFLQPENRGGILSFLVKIIRIKNLMLLGGETNQTKNEKALKTILDGVKIVYLYMCFNTVLKGIYQAQMIIF